ncbi:hypothetical protein 13VV501A_gene0012 [Vibrio phage 13VV501A]|nr:hypothetical protein 13VV501A_gene0012 [Vibrio phage 13VV501A]
MKIEEFETIIVEHLNKLGGTIQHTIKPETRGYTVTLSVDKEQYCVSKFYTPSDVERATVDTLRLQVMHLQRALCQCVLDRNLGPGVLYV